MFRRFAVLCPLILGLAAGAWGQAPENERLTPAEVRQMIDSAIKEHEAKKAEKKATDDDCDGYAVGSILNMNARWNHGVWFATPNDDFKFHVGGTMQYDMALFSVPDNVQFGTRGTGPFLDGVTPRRGRLRGEGSMYEVIDFLLEVEFFNGVEVTNAMIDEARNRTFFTPTPTSFWMLIHDLPVVGNCRVGNQKEPFLLDHHNGHRFLEFMERCYLFDAFTPTAFNNGFSPGIMFYNTMLDERATWWIGAFKNNVTLFGFTLGDGNYAVTGRLTCLPHYCEPTRSFVHFGISGSHRDPVDDQIRSRVRMEVRNAPLPLLPLIADTGFITCDTQDLVNIEHAEVWGPVTLQAEYTAATASNAFTPATGNVGTYFSHGGYVQVLYFLTGESRPYDKKNAVMGRVVPFEPFFFVPGNCGNVLGCGAWEVGVRYQYLDLTNKGINGGVLNDVTLGLNWYLNPNMKIQWNYDVAHRGDLGGTSDGWIQALGTRFALDF